MIMREIIATCSNPHVAGAAVASIGGDFERAFSLAAAERELSSGHLASCLVRAFLNRAEESDWDDVIEATRGSEMPVLMGVQSLLERARNISDESERSGPWQEPKARSSWEACASA